MPLIRGHHEFDDHFTQIPNAWLRDQELSLASIGLLAQLMSHSPGWCISIESLARQNNCGRDRIRKAMNELLSGGYLKRSDKQRHTPEGFLAGFDYITCDPPLSDLPTKVAPAKVTPLKVNPTHKKNKTKEEQSEEHKSFRATALPENWQPNERLLEMFSTKWVAVDQDFEIEQFKLYWWGTGRTHKNWDMTFQAWMNRAQKRLASSKDVVRQHNFDRLRELEREIENQKGIEE